MPAPSPSRPMLHRRNKTWPLRRTMRFAPGEVLATLDFVTPLADICRGWDQSEINAGRRLVRFLSLQEGHRLIVSCERITPEQYRPSDAVVSCIYREEVDDFFITSVDIIHLLQKLVGEEFAVMEKNRIRRNLEGLHPITVSKHRPGVEAFFQRIMDFPDPKPRNIEKDLKVFHWALLSQALYKIVSKYSICNLEQTQVQYSPLPSSEPESFSPIYIDPVIPQSTPTGSWVSDFSTDSEPEFKMESYFDGGAYNFPATFSEPEFRTETHFDGAAYDFPATVSEPEFKTENYFDSVYDFSTITFDSLPFQSEGSWCF